MSTSFAGKTVLISGAARGIGRAAAEAFGAEGATVVGLDLPGVATDETAAAVAAAGGAFLPVQGDVATEAGWAAAIAAAEKTGRLDVLVNNAGISGPIGSFLKLKTVDFDQVMAVNSRGVFLGMKAATPLLKLTKGTIVNVSSISGIGGGRHIMAYAASKHAVIGMTKHAAMELALSGVRVNAVCPAPTDTDMMKRLGEISAPDDQESFHAEFAKGLPMGRYGTPAEIAAVILFLSGPASSFMTGAVVPVDGGVRAR